MNALNYGSREACKRLFDAGIMLDTDCSWEWADRPIPKLIRTEDRSLSSVTANALFLPAPSMAEVWRELPEGCELWKDKYTHAANGPQGCETFDTNPTDALIDLLIWAKKEAKDD